MITTGGGNQHVFAGIGVTLLNESAANLTAGRLDRIDNFQTASGTGGTYIDLPGANAASTTFVAVGGGTAILTSANGGSGTAAIFVADHSMFDVQHQTLFNL